MPDEVKKKEGKKLKSGSVTEDMKYPKDAVKLKKRPKRAYGRLYARAVFTGFKRGLRNQHESTSSLKIDGSLLKSDSLFYVGKECVYVYRAKRKRPAPGLSKNKLKVRAIWGNVIRPHGPTGAVRAKFKSNLPAKAMGHKIRIDVASEFHFLSSMVFQSVPYDGSERHA